MTTDRVDPLDDLAIKVDDEFASYRESNKFKRPYSSIIWVTLDTLRWSSMSTGKKPRHWLMRLKTFSQDRVLVRFWSWGLWS